jgi:hypothetical protein
LPLFAKKVLQRGRARKLLLLLLLQLILLLLICLDGNLWL